MTGEETERERNETVTEMRGGEWTECEKVGMGET